jgi:luciferase family oxidoreductase group 1
MTKLSILDQAPMRIDGETGHALRDTLMLSHHTDALGFERYWIAEHHAMDCVAAAAPEIVIAGVGAVTGRIRIGSGGVLLPNHRPLHVAEQFRTLESLHPGRVDLGIGRSEGTLDDAVVTALGRSRANRHGSGFNDQLAELLSFGGARPFRSDHPLAGVRAMPDDVPLPPVYLLGSTSDSAETAAAHGFGFAFAYLINPSGAAAAIRHYRRRFMSYEGSEPYSILALRVYLAENDARARAVAAPGRLASARNRAGRPARLLPTADALRHQWDDVELAAAVRMHQEADVIGDPESVYARLTAIKDETRADEIMVLMNTHDPEDRKAAYLLLADMFGLEPSAAAPERTGEAGDGSQSNRTRLASPSGAQRR